MNPALWLIETVIVTAGGIWQGIHQDFNLVELAAIAIGVWAWKRKGWRPRKLPAIPAVARPGLAAIAIIVAAIAFRLALLPVLPVPIPIINDEFGHLLLADTLMHGRVSNPTHPFWPHFETINVLQQPKYVSNYFPGQAVMLAAGRIAVGSPWAGVLAEYALFLAALYWALRGWMPPRWALFGMVLAVVRFGIGSYWINAYHGGFLTAAGGALLFGAFPRLVPGSLNAKAIDGEASAGREPIREMILGLVFGSGLAILAATRPMEGVLFAAPFLAVLMWKMRHRIGMLLRVSFAAALVAVPAVAVLGVYFEHISGSPFVTAYELNQKTYGWPMGLPWVTPANIQNRHQEMRDYYAFEVGMHERVGSVGGFLQFLAFRLQEYWRFFFGPLLTIPLVMLGRMRKRRPLILMGAAGGIAGILLQGGASPHYLAAATAVLVAMVVEGCRYFDGFHIRLAPVLLAAMAVVLVLRIGLDQAGLPYTQKINYQSWCCRDKGNLEKAHMIAELHRLPGKHLLFVETKTLPDDYYQWIYNDADIDVARIVWARDLGMERNAELARYMSGRQIWLVNPNTRPATRVEYNPAAANDAPNAASALTQR